MNPQNVPVAEKCDVAGCGSLPSFMTDGSEKDAQKTLARPAIALLCVCDHHANWPHSADAQAWAAANASTLSHRAALLARLTTKEPSP